MLVKNIGGKESVSLPPEDRTGRAMAWNLKYCIKEAWTDPRCCPLASRKAMTTQRNHAHAKRGRSCTLYPSQSNFSRI